MPSDFVHGRGQPKTLADLIRQMDEGPRSDRPPMTTSPLAGSMKHRTPTAKKRSNKETDESRKRRAARQALREVKKDAESSSEG